MKEKCRVCGENECWDTDDYSWLSSRSGIHRTEPDGGLTSIFFIHGKRIRHQAHLPHGHHSPEDFTRMIQERCVGLDNPEVVSVDDTGAGHEGFWVEGTRNPVAEDWERIELARKEQRERDEKELVQIQKRLARFG